MMMESSPNSLSPNLTPEITRQTYQKRHSLNIVDESILNKSSLIRLKRPASSLGLTKLRSNSRRRLSSFLFRVVVIGSKAVGKTSLIRRYVEDDYSNSYSPTVSDVFEKSVMRADDEAVYMLKIYDTAGDLQYEFPAMYALTIAEGDMFVLVYSVENRKSIDILRKTWLDILERKEKNIGELPVVLVGSKSDVSATRRVVSEAEGQALAASIHCPFLEVSARTGRNQVDQIYKSLLQEMDKKEKIDEDLKNCEEENSSPVASGRKERSSTMPVERKSFSLKLKRKSKKGGCRIM